MKKCAILTMDSLENFEAYDHLIDEPLKGYGWQTELVSWHKKNVNWDQYNAVIIRTPWDYQDDAEAFLAVLNTINHSSAHLENSLAIVEWNIDKRYLKSLASQQVNIVPTHWGEQFQPKLLEQAFEQFNTSSLVIKPTVSANSDNTFWLTTDNYHTQIPLLTSIFSKRPFMIQPFMEHIVAEGEYSCFYFNGNFSHAILKTPKQNDFRVQEEHGGQLKLITPETELLSQAEHVIKQLPELPLYARVDFVRKNKSMSGPLFALMEAELIEPSLYFNMDPTSASRFAESFVTKMSQLGR